MIKDKEYLNWIEELSQRYRQSQIKAAVKINCEMLRFYWTIGQDIEPQNERCIKSTQSITKKGRKMARFLEKN